MRRSFLAGACGLALLGLPIASAFAQTQTQTPAAQPPATAQKPAPGAEPAPADDPGNGSDDAAGEDQNQGPIAFEGGQLTITGDPDSEKTLAFDGKKLASNYQVYFDKIVKVGGVNVALVDVGDGGNQCGPAKLIVWKPEGGAITSLTVEQNQCGAPPASVSDNSIYFVPYLMPGEEQQALQWSPADGLTTSGLLSYMPEPGTRWSDIDPGKYQNIVDAFHNEAVYNAARKLLGGHLTDMATSLLVGGGTEKTASGAFYASGCVPHDCGGNDGFMAVDVKKHALYFARKGEHPQPDTWPALKSWPADIKDAFDKAFN